MDKLTREEKIIKIADLCEIKYAQEEYDDIFDPKRYEVIPREVMYKRTLDYLNSYTDEELDVIYDEVWATIRDISLNRLLPEDL